MKNAIFVCLTSLLLFSCKKDPAPLDTQSISQESLLSMAELHFLNQLSLQNRTEDVVTRSESPENSNNPYDYFGEQLSDGFKLLQAMQYTDSAASSSEEYVSQWLSLTDFTNLSGIDSSEFTTLEEETLSFFLEYFTNTTYSVDYLVDRFKAAENLVVSSNLFTTNQKKRILAFSSSLKYLKYEIWNNGIVLEEVNVILTGWWSCWESNFSSGMNSNVLSSLFDWEDSPVSTAMNWLGFPQTMIGCIGDAAWNAGNGC